VGSRGGRLLQTYNKGIASLSPTQNQPSSSSSLGKHYSDRRVQQRTSYWC